MITLLSQRAVRSGFWIPCVATAALAWGGVFLVLAAAADGAEPVSRTDIGVAALQALLYTGLAVLGATVTSHQPRNPVGWLLQLIPLALAITTTTTYVYLEALSTSDRVEGVAAYVAWVSSWMWILAIVPAFTIFPLLFPTGRALSRRWGALVPVAVVAATLMWFGTAFAPGPIPNLSAAVNPFGIGTAVTDIAVVIGSAVLIPTSVASIASVIVRFRRSSGIERQQLTWVAAAATLLPAGFLGAGFEGDVGYVILLCSLSIVGLAVAVAMLRYRLYDIDVVINRTLVYGALTATLAAAYAGGVLLLQFVLEPITQDSKLAVAGSTLAVAALFRPARARIQTSVDRRFYRSRYDATRTLAAFSARLRDDVDLDNLGRQLRGVVGAAMQPVHVSLWMRER